MSKQKIGRFPYIQSHVLGTHGWLTPLASYQRSVQILLILVLMILILPCFLRAPADRLQYRCSGPA